MRNVRRTGFTLIELLLVLVILAVLTTIVATRFVGRTEQAKITAAKTAIDNFKTALHAFEVDNGRFPSTDEGLRALLEQPNGLTNWHGPYLDGSLKDPWEHEYIYQFPGQHNPSGFDIHSMGPDGNEGNDDIDNWTH